MNRKQLFHIADEIVKQEKIVKNENSSQEEKDEATKIISRYANMVMAMGPRGFEIIAQLDDIIQKKLEK